MSHQGAVEASPDEIADLEAFAARFPPVAFEPIAVALGKSTEPQSLNALREWLLPDFHSFYSSGTADRRARTKRERELMKRGKAAAALFSSLRSGWFLNQPRELLDAPFRRKVMDVLEKLADPARIGQQERYRPKDAFRKDLTPGLIWVYEHITGERARKPRWLRDGGGYGGPFYRFACAVRACLYDRLPEVRPCLSATAGALAQELQDHWPEVEK